MFPSLSTKDRESAMFVGPPIKINGNWYVGGSPGIPLDAAASAQFCIWPDPVTPRNCGPPAYKQETGTLILRQVPKPNYSTVLPPPRPAHLYAFRFSSARHLGILTISTARARTHTALLARCCTSAFHAERACHTT